MNRPSIGFIGAGVLARSLAMALQAGGYRVEAVSSRSFSSAQAMAGSVPRCTALGSPQEVSDRCNLVFITTPDDAIGQVASQVSWRPGQGVVHCSGALSLEGLEPCAACGASVASFHPLQTMACVDSLQEALARLSGITYAIQGEGWPASFLEEAAVRLGGTALHVPDQDRPLYHAMALLACGYVGTLLKVASRVWKEMGLPVDRAAEGLSPLAATTVSNLRQCQEQVITGPIVRGDLATVSSHLEALKARVPRVVPLYCILGLASLSETEDGVEERKAQQLRLLLEHHLRESLGR